MGMVTLIPGDGTRRELTDATRELLGTATGAAIIETPAAGATPTRKEQL